jgi:acetyltransferase-like isoleucine patch superfamily enzyme
MAKVAPGVRMEEGAMLAMGSLTTSNLDAWQIFNGAPAAGLKKREIETD